MTAAYRTELSAGSQLLVDPAFLKEDEATNLLNTLTQTLPLQQQTIRIAGRQVAQPRLTCWVGDHAYTYSGLRNLPQPWTPELTELRDRVSAAVGVEMNSVLANLYRTGQDSMGWHADDEREMGPCREDIVVGSISLGAPRRFQLKQRHGTKRHELILEHGSLLVMRGRTQLDWKHCLPKTKASIKPRLNLTFRQILADQM